MTKQRFETALQQLTPRRREVLEHFLVGESDQKIAQSLNITEGTVRQHVRNICQTFGIKKDIGVDCSAQRVQLIALFAQYKPELLPEPTVTEAQNQASESILPSHTSTSNKQEACSTEYDPNFLGRNDDIAHLDNLINKKGAKIIQIIAPGGTGKTRLAQKYLESKFKIVIEFTIARERKDIASVQSLVEGKLRQLDLEPGRELMVSLERLKQKLQTDEMGILIDNLEPALDASGKFLEQHRSYVELLRVLTDSRVKSLTLITSREKLHEASIEIETYSLPGLNLAAWQEYFNHQKIIINNESLQEIRDAFGGNAKAMNVISNAIIQDYDGDLEKYWLKNKKDLLIEPTLENLIKEQFKRLQEINLHDAYNLLCRMGCYRYQDVPTVPENGLCSLLWDVPKNNHQRIIKVLKERALIEFNNDEYWLHPVIRQEAIERLRNSEDWEKANIQAAEFWKNHNNSIKNKEEALIYIESLLHYYEAHKYELAFYVLYERVHIENSNRFLGNQLIYWGYSFYLINFLKKLICKLPKYLEVYALLRIGICFYYIGNYEESVKFLNQAIEIMKIFPDDYQYQKAYPECLNCLARTTIRLGNLNKGVQICGQALSKIQFIKSRFDLEISQDPDISVQKYFYFERQESNTLQTVSEINFYLAEYEKAIQKCHQGLQIIKNVKNNKFYKEEGDIIAILSICWYAKGKVKRAIRMMEKAILNFQIFEDKQSEGFARCYLVIFYLKTDLYKAQENMIIVENILKESSNTSFIKSDLSGDLLKVKAEFYRMKNNFEKAISHHQESIAILERIDGKCDLAEAYFQLALTYQKKGDKANSEEYFNKAMYLWSPEQIDAPKQIERVLKAMNCES